MGGVQIGLHVLIFVFRLVVVGVLVSAKPVLVQGSNGLGEIAVEGGTVKVELVGRIVRDNPWEHGVG